MTQNLKIEVLTGDISIDGMVVTNLVTKEELSTAIVKKADLGADGKIPTSQLPAEIVNTAGIVDEVKLQLETSIKDAVDESNAYAESYTDNALTSKADLASGKVPLEQLPAIDQYPQFDTALSNLSTSILSATKQRTDQLEKSKADLGEDGKVLREQIPSYEKISGLPEQLEVMSTQTAAVSGELDEHKLQTADQIDTLKENINSNSEFLMESMTERLEGYADKDAVKRGIANRYDSSLTYNLGERVVLANGDAVKSTIDGNVNDPNNDMTGWHKTNSASQIYDKSGLSQQDINDKFSGARKVDLSYLKWPNGFDVSAILDELLKLSQIAPIHIILPQGKYTISSSVGTGENGKGVILDLNGSVIKPSEHYTSSNAYAITLISTTKYPCILTNGTLDGDLRKQNLFEYTDIQDYYRDVTHGFFASAQTIAIDNFTFQNLYGQTTKTDCRNLSVKNTRILNCGGHWYTNNGYDMFGDAFYIGTGTGSGVIQAEFDNVLAYGKKSSDYPENHKEGTILTQIQYSRAGLVLENFGNTQNDVRISFNNCDFRYFERGFHQEITGITSYITLKNTRFDSCALFGAYLTDTMHGYAENCQLGFYDSEYNGSKGISRGYSGVSIVELKNSTVSNLGTAANYQLFGTGGNVSASQCKFVNVSNELCSNTKLSLKDCEVNILKRATSEYLAWEGSIELDNVQFKYVGTDANVFEYYGQLGSYMKIVNSSFDRIFIGVDAYQMGSNFKNNKLIVNNGNTGNYKGLRWTVVDKENKVLFFPSIYWGVSEETFNLNRYKKVTVAKSLSPLINIGDILLDYAKTRSSLFVVVIKGHDDGVYRRLNDISYDQYGGGYYVAVCKYDLATNKVVITKPITSVGSTNASGFDLTFDANLNITGYGGYASYVHIAAVPYSEIDTLPYIPSAIF